MSPAPASHGVPGRISVVAEWELSKTSERSEMRDRVPNLRVGDRVPMGTERPWLGVTATPKSLTILALRL